MSRDFSIITEEINAWTRKCIENSCIDPKLYAQLDVKRGLRDLSGKGVLAGLTEIGDVKSYEYINGEQTPCEGKLYYRGIDMEKIVEGFTSEGRFGFEETAYLLLLGKLKNAYVKWFTGLT